MASRQELRVCRALLPVGQWLRHANGPVGRAASRCREGAAIGVGLLIVLLVNLTPFVAVAAPGAVHDRFHLGVTSSPVEPATPLDLVWRPSYQSSAGRAHTDAASAGVDYEEQHRAREKVRGYRVLERVFHASGWPLAIAGWPVAIGPSARYHAIGLPPNPSMVMPGAIMIGAGIVLIVNALVHAQKARRLEERWFPNGVDAWDEEERKREGEEPLEAEKEPKTDPDEEDEKEEEPETEPPPNLPPWLR